jgi:hypothetical protein
MPKKNYELETRITEYIRKHPGLVRRQISKGLQMDGVRLGQQHLSNRVGELVAFGELKEQITEDGRRLIYPVKVLVVQS